MAKVQDQKKSLALVESEYAKSLIESEEHYKALEERFQTLMREASALQQETDKEVFAGREDTKLKETLNLQFWTAKDRSNKDEADRIMLEIEAVNKRIAETAKRLVDKQKRHDELKAERESLRNDLDILGSKVVARMKSANEYRLICTGLIQSMQSVGADLVQAQSNIRLGHDALSERGN